MEWQTTRPAPAPAGRCPARQPLDPRSAAARAQAAELIDEGLKDDFVQGTALLTEPGRSPAERTADEQMIRAEIQASMKAAGVPLASVVFRALPAGRRGEFDRATWTLLIDHAAIHAEGRRVELLGTVYHEARHAEQFFDAMRAFAALHPCASANAFNRLMHAHRRQVPPLHIVQAAFRVPSLESAPRRWYRLYFGTDAAALDEARARYQQARFQWRAFAGERRRWDAREKAGWQPSEAQRSAHLLRWRTLEASYDAARDAYLSQPDEADAHALGDQIRARLEGSR